MVLEHFIRVSNPKMLLVLQVVILAGEETNSCCKEANTMSDLETIHATVDAIVSTKAGITSSPKGKKPRLFRGKGMKKLSAIGIALILISMTGLAVLIYTLTQYNVEVSGNVDVEGTSEYSNILLDDVRLSELNTILPMDFSSISFGETQTASHTIENLDGNYWDVTFDTSDMDELIDDELDEFYGVTYSIEIDGVNVTDFVLSPSELETVTFYLVVNPLFLETSSPFPFSLSFSIAMMDVEYQVGVYATVTEVGATNSWITLSDTDGVLLDVYNSTETFYQVAHPSTASDWTILQNTYDSVTYDHPDGINFTGDYQQVYRALVKNFDLPEATSYVIESAIRFNSHQNTFGYIFNYQNLDGENYYLFSIMSGLGGTIKHFVNGVEVSSQSVAMYNSANTVYPITLTVDNVAHTLNIYFDGADRGTYSIA